MDNEIQTVQATQTTPADLVTFAMEKGADIEKIEQLMVLQQRWEEREAEKAYHVAVAGFKSEAITIMKNKKVAFGSTEFNHASLDHALEVAVPELSKHGLSHYWEPNQSDENVITITCHLTHSLGYGKSVSLHSSPDPSGSMNPLQRIASATSYLERYTFLMITGLAAKDQDDDGRGSGQATIDKKVFQDGVDRGIKYGMACYLHKEVIETMKDRLADGDYLAAAEAYYSLTNKEQISIKRAPTKGGIFTIDEVELLKCDEWNDVGLEAIKLNPTVDRSI